MKYHFKIVKKQDHSNEYFNSNNHLDIKEGKLIPFLGFNLANSAEYAGNSILISRDDISQRDYEVITFPIYEDGIDDIPNVVTANLNTGIITGLLDEYDNND